MELVNLPFCFVIVVFMARTAPIDCKDFLYAVVLTPGPFTLSLEPHSTTKINPRIKTM